MAMPKSSCHLAAHKNKDDVPLPWEDTTILEDNPRIHNSNTVFYVLGTGPLVLTAPHGGNLLPTTIPDRTTGCLEPDIHSAQLAWEIYLHCQKNSSNPSLVIGKLHRRKVDLARARSSAAKSEVALEAWEDYHSAIQQALDAAIKNHGYAHLVDLHGQSHRPATEVGHLLTNSDLRSLQENNGDASNLLPKSSLLAMSTLPTFQSLEDVVRGPFSIGSLLEKAGYPAVPSSRQPVPCCTDCVCIQQQRQSAPPAPGCCNEECCCMEPDPCRRPCTGLDVVQWSGGPDGCGPCAFFWGSNTLIRYGGGRRNSKGESVQLTNYRGLVATTQLETGWKGARENQEQIEPFAGAVGDAILGFMAHFYGDTHS